MFKDELYAHMQKKKKKVKKKMMFKLFLWYIVRDTAGTLTATVLDLLSNSYAEDTSDRSNVVQRSTSSTSSGYCSTTI